MTSLSPRLWLLSLAVVGCAAGATAKINQTQPRGPTPVTVAPALETRPPAGKNSVKFLVLGDTGTGDRAQYEVAAQAWKSHSVFPFEFAIMLGDNMYGSERPQDFARKFEVPYKPMLDANVSFYAALGNHDDPNQRYYKPFGMGGQRFYTFQKPDVRFFVLDSNYMDKDQQAWLEKELAASNSKWKIAYCHHPLYSSGARHGAEIDLRTIVEPLFIKYGVNVVLAGHEADYKFKAIDSKGYSRGYDVIDPAGKKWDVKTGNEAQPEVVASRVLWAVGYHQPIMYFVPEWKLRGGPESRPLSGRFRLSSDHRTFGDWSWTENPFKGTRELRGLVVVNLILNNWDLKSSQNRVYSVAGTPNRWFVVQDLGASLGKTAWPTGTKLDIEDFESQDLVKGVENGRALFDYHARHKELLEDITPEDVAWVCTLLNTITDKQWDELFRHVGIPGETSARYIRKIKSKINEGLTLTRTTPAKRL